MGWGRDQIRGSLPRNQSTVAGWLDQVNAAT
jgi:hypothetical protein